MPSANEKAPRGEVARRLVRRVALVAATLACLTAAAEAGRSRAPYPTPEEKAAIDSLVVHYAKRYGVPVSLARKVVRSESEYRPLARNGPYWGLMQIRYDTAQSMGYKGTAKGLLDAETNLAYGMAYLANAMKAGDGSMSRGHMLYRTGYYYAAKRKGVLKDLIVVRDFKPIGDAPVTLAMAESAEGTGGLWSGEGTGAAPATASAAIAAVMAAPMPRARPAVMLAAATGAESPATAAAAKPPAETARAEVAEAPVAKPLARPTPASPAVANPTVVYASVLPFSRPAAPAKAEPLLSAPIVSPELAAAAATEPVVAAGDIPFPRPKPMFVIAFERPDGPKTPLEIALEAAAAKAGQAIGTARGKAEEPPLGTSALRPALDRDEAAPLVVAHGGAPLPRVRPTVAE